MIDSAYSEEIPKKKEPTVTEIIIENIREIIRGVYVIIYRSARRHRLLSLLILMFLIYIFVQYIYYPLSLTLTGTLSSGIGDRIIQLAFYNVTNASVGRAELANGGYSISLPNVNATYKVVSKWLGNYPWQTGGFVNTTVSIIRTTFGLTGSIIKNLNLPAPDSMIKLIGNVHITAASQKIYFLATNQTVQPQISNIQALTGYYNVSLPNFVTYKVVVSYSNVSLSSIKTSNITCDSGYQLHEGTGISNLSKSFNC